MNGERDELAWQEVGGRFGSNLARVKLLADHANSAPQIQLSEVTDLRSDILRSAIILLHATLEDLLRSLAEILLPWSNAKELKEIPLLGSTKPRQTTFTLEDLAAHRGGEVSDLIVKSVAAYLERSNYNHPGDIKALLQSIAIPASLCDPYARELAAMMSRRHLIAHRADRRVGVGALPLAIERVTVERWIGTVASLGGKLLDHVRSSSPEESEADA